MLKINNMVFESYDCDGVYTNQTFVNCTFYKCMFNNQQFVDCTFINCVFTHCMCEHTNFIKCTFIDSMFSEVLMNSLDKGKIDACKFINHRIIDTDFGVCEFTDTSFTGYTKIIGMVEVSNDSIESFPDDVRDKLISFNDNGEYISKSDYSAE